MLKSANALCMAAAKGDNVLPQIVMVTKSMQGPLIDALMSKLNIL
jgi:hypothetical protein